MSVSEVTLGKRPKRFDPSSVVVPSPSADFAEAVAKMEEPFPSISYKDAPSLLYRVTPRDWNLRARLSGPVLINLPLSQFDATPASADSVDAELGLTTSFWGVEITEDQILEHPWINPSLHPGNVKILVSTIALRMFVTRCGPRMTMTEAVTWLRRLRIPHAVLFHSEFLDSFRSNPLLEAPEYVADDYELPFLCIRFPKGVNLKDVHVPREHFALWVEEATRLTRRLHGARFLDVGGMVARVVEWLNPNLLSTDPLRPTPSMVTFRQARKEADAPYWREYVSLDEHLFLVGTVFP